MPSTASKHHTSIRESFNINRQLEFFTESELAKQLGHHKHWWYAVLVAELIDNSLDHCEEVGILPSISVTVQDDSISVTDNGRGIPASVVASMVDFDTRTSSRLNYACPTRGAQRDQNRSSLELLVANTSNPHSVAQSNTSGFKAFAKGDYPSLLKLHSANQTASLNFRPE